MAPAERNLEPKSADPKVQADPTPENFPVTEGQAAVQQREAQAQSEREKRAEKQREDQIKATKTSAEEKQLGDELAKVSQTNPAAARSMHQGINIDGFTRRHGGEPLTGHFVRVCDGDNAGRYGVYEENATVDDTGYPLTVILTTRDDRHERLVVPFDDLEPAEAGAR